MDLSKKNTHKISIKENFKKGNIEYTCFKYCFKRKNLIIKLVGGIILLIIIYFLQRKLILNYGFDNNFDYINYERDLINEKIKKNAGWILGLDDAAFINGLIRKH